jgi:hypothetical protein
LERKAEWLRLSLAFDIGSIINKVQQMPQSNLQQVSKLELRLVELILKRLKVNRPQDAIAQPDKSIL